MSTLGKLLIVFNLLAAGAFAYFTLNDWQVRQDLTWAALTNQVRLDGLAVEPETPARADLGSDRVAFLFTMPDGGPRYTSIPKDRLAAMIPQGGTTFGGEPVTDQTAEVKRLQQRVFGQLPAMEGQNPPARLVSLRNYLLGVAQTGAERDGVIALFEMRDPTRRDSVKKDLALLGRTNSQVSALQAMVAIASLGSDPQAIMPDDVRATRVRDAREAVRRFLQGEKAHGLPVGTKKEDQEWQTLTNAIESAFAAGAGDAEKKKLADSATADTAGWTELAKVAVEPLTDKASVDRATEALSKFAALKAVTPTEASALAGLKTLITLSNPEPVGFAIDPTLNEVSSNLLNAKFDEAALASGSHKGHSEGEKARQIAHLLYHIDSYRHAVRAGDAKNDEIIADRKAWHERVATVVGLPEYIRTAETQANEYAEAGQRLISVITAEESRFEADYQSKQQKALALYAQWLALDSQLKAQEAITKENETLRDQRLTERDNLVAELQKATVEAKEALARLNVTQGKLYAIQKDLRDAQAAILDLEKELRRLELGPEERKRDATGNN